MKGTGIVRRIDELGRIVLPIELRRTLGISEHDALEIYVKQDSIILKKYSATCLFCGSSSNLSEHRGKNVCSKCLEEMKQL